MDIWASFNAAIELNDLRQTQSQDPQAFYTKFDELYAQVHERLETLLYFSKLLPWLRHEILLQQYPPNTIADMVSLANRLYTLGSTGSSYPTTISNASNSVSFNKRSTPRENKNESSKPATPKRKAGKETSNDNKRRRTVCWRCGKPSHIARDCYTILPKSAFRNRLSNRNKSDNRK